MGSKKRARPIVCKKCNRPLRDAVSQKRGYGPVCWSKRTTIVQAKLEKEGQMRLPGL